MRLLSRYDILTYKCGVCEVKPDLDLRALFQKPVILLTLTLGEISVNRC